MANTPSAQELADELWKESKRNLERALNALYHLNFFELPDDEYLALRAETERLIRERAEGS